MTHVLFEMVEGNASTLAKADARRKDAGPVSVIGHAEAGLFDIYLVASGDSTYTVTRFAWFIKCDCPDFHFTRSICKHAIVCFPPVCRVCFTRPVSRAGIVCKACSMDTALRYRTPQPTAERFGSVRI